MSGVALEMNASVRFEPLFSPFVFPYERKKALMIHFCLVLIPVLLLDDKAKFGADCNGIFRGD